MRISAAFPSNYIKAADLLNRQVTVTIDRVTMEDIGDDHKPVLYFVGKEKGLVLNKTNSNNIAAVFGDETDGWVGGKVLLYPTMVDFQGRSVEAIRVRAIPSPVATPQNFAAPPRQRMPPAAPVPSNAEMGWADAPAAPQQTVAYRDPLDDEIPF